MSTLTSPAHPKPAPEAIPPADRGIILIALFKLAKGILFTLLGIAALGLIHHSADEVVRFWMRTLGVRQESRLVQNFLQRVGPFVNSWRMLIAPLLFFYAALFFTEGGGLLARKRWAEWLTVVLTCSLLPVEIYELCRPNGWRIYTLKICALVINLIIIWFLVAYLRRVQGQHKAPPAEVPAADPVRVG